MRPCRAPGCGARTTRYGAYCTTHKSRFRRHGAPDQDAISKADLAPYIARVLRRIEKNDGHAFWGELYARWEAAAISARAQLRQFSTAATVIRHKAQAYEELVKLADKVPGSDVVHVILAMFLMLKMDPRRFSTDQAFRTQLVRRVRGLTDVNSGTWFDHRTGRTKRAYREMTPRATAALADVLVDVAGTAGLHLARLELRDLEHQQDKDRAFLEALAQLQ